MDKLVPRVRFKGYTDDWELRQLNEISKRVQGNDSRMNLPTLTISAASGWLDQKNRFSKNQAGKEQKNYTLLSRGELSYNHGNSKLAKYGIVYALRGYSEALVPRVYHSFRIINNNSSGFIEYLFATKILDKQLREIITSGARMDGLLNISYSDFSNIKMYIPKEGEQRDIEQFLYVFDNAINLQQRQLDLYKKLKQGLLQKLFPSNGEKVPVLRFADFHNNWEQHKLGDLMKVGSVKRIHQSDWKKQGVRFLRARDIVSAYKGKKDQDLIYISKEKYLEYSKISGKVSKNDLLVTGVGTIGVPILIKNDNPVYFKDGNIIWFQNNNKLNGDFFYNSFNSGNIQSFIKNVSGAGTVSTYTIKNGQKTPMLIPLSEEQRKIGDIFNRVNNLITLQQKKLNSLKKLKKFCSQNLFI